MSEKNGRRRGHPCAISTAHTLAKLTEVFFGPDRRAVPPLLWPAAPQLAEEPVVRKPQQAAPAAGLPQEERSDATGVSPRRPAVG
jgi:hypothetical protein